MYIAKTAVVYKNVDIGMGSKIYDHVVIREGTVIGNNTIIGNLVAIEPKAKIGNNCSINTQSHVTGGIVIEDDVFFGPNVTTTNTWTIGYRRPNIRQVIEAPIIKRGARIGGGATILPRVIIGEEALVGAGSVVTKNIGKREVWVGNPAKYIGHVPEEEWL